MKELSVFCYHRIVFINAFSMLFIIELRDRLPNLNANWETVWKYVLYTEFTAPQENATEIAKKIKHFYFGDQEISNSTFQELTKVIFNK